MLYLHINGKEESNCVFAAAEAGAELGSCFSACSVGWWLMAGAGLL
jgi:hypothetical protein